jgi:hypothetical protein
MRRRTLATVVVILHLTPEPRRAFSRPFTLHVRAREVSPSLKAAGRH